MRVPLRFDNLWSCLVAFSYMYFFVSSVLGSERSVLRIIFVEDMPVNTHLAKHAFTQFNGACGSCQLSVNYFNDGKDIKWDDVRGCHLILTDINMPGESGDAMLSRLRVEKPRNELMPKCVAVTSDHETPDAVWKEKGFAGRYAKISHVSHIHKILEEHLAEYRVSVLKSESEESLLPATEQRSTPASPVAIPAPALLVEVVPSHPRMGWRWFRSLCCGCF